MHTSLLDEVLQVKFSFNLRCPSNQITLGSFLGIHAASGVAATLDRSHQQQYVIDGGPTRFSTGNLTAFVSHPPLYGLVSFMGWV